MKPFEKLLGSAALAGVLVFATPALALAEGYGSPDGYGSGDSVSDPTPEVGQTITVTATGFRANSSVTLTMYSNPIVLGTFTANAQGVVTATVTLPAGVSGSHNLVFSGVDPSNNPRNVTIPITISAPAGSGTGSGSGSGGGSGSFLPRTGASTMGVLMIGGVLVAVGGAATVATRKRLSAVEG